MLSLKSNPLSRAKALAHFLRTLRSSGLSFLLFVVLASATMSSCSLRINEPMPAQERFEVNVGADCLTKSGNTLDRFFAGQSNPGEIDTFWGCLDTSIESFLKNTQGQDPNAYEPQELANFISKYFLLNAKIHPQLLEEFMYLKVALFGGNQHKLSRQEIQQVRTLFSQFALASKKIAPHLPLSAERILQKIDSVEDLDEVISAVEETGDIVTTSLASGLGNYSFQRIEGLLFQLKIYGAQNSAPMKWIEGIQAYLPILKKLKSLTISPDGEWIQKEDWKRLATTGPKLYSLYLRFQLYFPGSKPELFGKNLFRFSRLLDEALPILEQALLLRASPKITEAEIESILEELHRRQFMQKPPKEIKEVLALVLKRFLPDPASKNPYEVTLTNINEFRILYRYFIDGLHTISAIFEKSPTDSELSSKTLTRKKAVAKIEELGEEFSIFPSETAKVVHADLKFLLQNVSLVHPVGKDIVVVRGPGDFPQSQGHLLTLFYYNTVNKLVLRAYGNQKKRSISEKQIRFLLTDLEPLFRLFDISTTSLARGISGRLFEASLFLPSSDRYLNLNHLEALELESLLFSVMKEAPDLHDSIQKYCKTRSEKVHPQCYREELSERISKSLRGVPLMAEALAQREFRDRVEIIGNLDLFLRKSKIDSAYSEDDTRSILLTLYYIELLFYRFDKNENGLIENEEAKLAYPFFQEFIAEKANALGRTKAEEHYKIYTYILAKRKVPSTFFEKLDYLNWKKTNAFAIDRAGILDIFSTIISF